MRTDNPEKDTDTKSHRKYTPHGFFAAANMQMMCSDTQCIIPEVQAPVMTSSTFPGLSGTSFVDVLPDDLYEMLKQAAAKGLLFSFLCSLPAEFLADYLREHGRTDGEIQLCTQALRALVMISLGADIAKTLAAPLVSWLLTNLTGISEQYSSIITTAGVVSLGLFSDQTHIGTAVATMAASLCASILGYQAARICHDYVCEPRELRHNQA